VKRFRSGRVDGLAKTPISALRFILLGERVQIPRDLRPGYARRLHRLLNDTHELLADVARFAAVESKDILIQIVLKVFGLKSTLKRSYDQSFDHGGHQMNTI
jgi:hypothetical protein